MFGELPKLFGRDFAIGCFLPVVVFFAITLPTTELFEMWPALSKQIKSDLPIGVTLVILLSWVVATTLLGLNQLIYRVLEGYGSLNPARLMRRIELCRFRRLSAEISRLEQSVDSVTGQPLQAALLELQKLGIKLAQRYPDSEEWLLPTSFGNTIRAFEVYPRVMYGLEGIQGWVRLLGVIPKDYIEVIGSTKALADLWVNSLVLTLAYLISYVGLCAYTGRWIYLWIPALAAVMCVAFYSLGRGGVEAWGELVKSAFDVFLLDLQKKLPISPQKSDVAEREVWERFSQAMVYRKPAHGIDVQTHDKLRQRKCRFTLHCEISKGPRLRGRYARR